MVPYRRADDIRPYGGGRPDAAPPGVASKEGAAAPSLAVSRQKKLAAFRFRGDAKPVPLGIFVNTAKAALRSLLLPFQIEAAALGFDLAGEENGIFPS